ncbi:hypothetical protein VZT92_007074 [Zoarces viviparus]|uniref:Uncharacterized protein n=1 Tax=Zoarces viviparus TaxID=48416 RepID=A0AAW1FK05_ZOAVI
MNNPPNQSGLESGLEGLHIHRVRRITRRRTEELVERDERRKTEQLLVGDERQRVKEEERTAELINSDGAVKEGGRTDRLVCGATAAEGEAQRLCMAARSKHK